MATIHPRGGHLMPVYIDADLIAPSVPARADLTSEEFKVWPLAIALDALVHFVRLARMLAPRCQGYFANVFRCSFEWSDLN
jgi:hypothetical protein